MTTPGPGRPPNWWKAALAVYEPDAVQLIGETIRRAAQKQHRYGRIPRSNETGVAIELLNRLHGKPTQPLEHRPAIDLAQLSEGELTTLERILARHGYSIDVEPDGEPAADLGPPGVH